MTDVLGAAPAPVTPTPPPSRWRRHRTSLIIVGFLVLAVAVLVVFGDNTERRNGSLDPDNPGPDGAQAVARVLADQGVDVTVVRSADELDDTEIGSDTTVVVTSTEQLGSSTIGRLRDQASAAEIVLVDAAPGTLGVVDGDVVPTEVDTDDAVAAGCDDALFDGLEIEVDDADGYEGSGDGCFDDAYLQGDDVTLFGAGDALTNDQVLRADNAAVALRMLGQRDRLVWYVPTYDDLVGDDGVGGASLLPDWVEPGLGVLLLASILLILWRVRRLGPLATEPLPVTIKAIETTRSRGRLYRKSGDRAHAAAALRAAASERAAARLRLGRGGTEADLVRDVARHVGRPEGEVQWLLSAHAPAPTSDRDLIHLANAVAALEEEVRRS